MRFSSGAGPRRRLAACALAVAAVLALSGPASAAPVVNGSFESGSFAGWNVHNEPGGSGSWFVYSGTKAPLSRMTIAAPPEGRYAAISDQVGPGAHVLLQDFVLPAEYVYTLSFVWYYGTAAPFRAPASLSFRVSPNQQYRVDLMSPSAPVFSVAPGDVWAPLAATHPGDPPRLAPTPVSVDLSSYAGRTVRLRFAEVDNQGYLQAGVDSVRVFTSPTTRDQCSGDGWKDLADPSGTPFKNAGDCRSWVATHGRNPAGTGNEVSPPMGPPVSRPVGPPVSPPVGPPVSRPVGPPVSPPVGPPTP